MSFIKINSDEIQLGQAKLDHKEDRGLVVKIPTDDSRVMLVLMPAAFISDLVAPLDQTILDVLNKTHFEENEDRDVVNIFMPSFSKSIELDLGCFQGVKMDNSNSIEAGKLKIKLEIAKGLKNPFDLRDRRALDEGIKIEGDFVFVLYDDSNDHLLVAMRVLKKDFLPYKAV